jgi:catechol 2,3-dioxygenase-like lactoylglutathione lyase family enzyme
MIGPIRCVTITADDPAALADTYTRWLGYRRLESGTPDQVDPAEARGWGAPAQAGSTQVLLAPERGEDFWFRLVQGPPGDYRALTTWGWNAAELIVEDVDALAGRLADSPFRTIGPPEDLSFTDAIRAMQVEGPAREVLYLTQFKRRLAEFDTPEPRCAVDRTFIVILGGPNLEALQRYYEQRFGVPEAPAMPVKVSVLSNALGLSPDTLHDIAALPLQGQSFIEADRYPVETAARTSREGCLPPAMAMVSFVVPDLAPHLPDALGPVYGSHHAPYLGARAITVTGPAGELIELLELPH